MLRRDWRWLFFSLFKGRAEGKQKSLASPLLFCYSSDLLLRQYKRVKSERKKLFSYRDIRPVYTIVLFEESPREFRSLPDRYLHRSRQVFDTGLEMDLLQKYIRWGDASRLYRR